MSHFGVSASMNKKEGNTEIRGSYTHAPVPEDADPHHTPCLVLVLEDIQQLVLVHVEHEDEIDECEGQQQWRDAGVDVDNHENHEQRRIVPAVQHFGRSEDSCV